MRTRAQQARYHSTIDRCVPSSARCCACGAPIFGRASARFVSSYYSAQRNWRPAAWSPTCCALYQPNFPSYRRGEVPEGKAAVSTERRCSTNICLPVPSLLYSRGCNNRCRGGSGSPRAAGGLAADDMKALYMLCGVWPAIPNCGLDMNFMPGRIQLLHNLRSCTAPLGL